MFRIGTTALRLTNYKWTTSRCLGTSSHVLCNKKPEVPIKLKDFTPVYHYKVIQYLGLVNRLKYYQTVATAFAIPFTFTLNMLNIVSSEAIIGASLFGFSGCATLYTVGILTNKLIGFVYINKDKTLVRIAYVDFWGRRQDAEIPQGDIIPICNESLSKMDKILFYSLKRYSVDDTYKMSLTHGQVLDEEGFKAVFGVKKLEL